MQLNTNLNNPFGCPFSLAKSKSTQSVLSLGRSISDIDTQKSAVSLLT